MKLKKIILLLILTLPCALAAQEKSRIRFNYGIKAGFQALTYNDPEFEIDGYIFDSNNIQSSKIGYTIAPFIRATYKSFYLQTETTFGMSRQSFEFSEAETEQTDYIPGMSVYNLKTFCVQVPLLFGYNFIDQKVFGMSVFTGPRIKHIISSHNKQEFNNFKYSSLREELEKTTYYWEIGLGVKIGNVFFDFVYDIGLSDTSKYLEAADEEKRFKTSRSDNVLSFSVGMIF